MPVIESETSPTASPVSLDPMRGLSRVSHLRLLEAESLHILREVVSEFERPVMLYSVGKDSSVMLRLAQKAFYPGPIPFPLLHVDTGFKFHEMIAFRDEMARSVGAELLVWRNETAIAAGTNPIALDTKRCCGLLKTQALLDALKHYNFDAAFGGARRDEEKSRAKERIYSFRDSAGQWDPKNQRPELWNLYNARIHPGESIRVFPLSNWTEMDVWQYIHEEKIPIVDLYFAKERPMYVRGDGLLRGWARSRKWSSRGCARWDAVLAPGLFARMRIRSPRSLPNWFRSARRSAPIASSITTRKARWN
jgi:sulfate adenylyltransferase subunit 2